MASSDSYFLLKDGTVKACGYNNFGQLGLGHKNQVNTPTTIPNLDNVKQMLWGNYSVTALLKDGTGRLIGNNNYNFITGGAPGSDVLVATLIPKMVGIKEISGVGKNYLLTLKDGTQKVWGKNSFGCLGVGHRTSVEEFSDIYLKEKIKKIVIGDSHSALLLEDGTVRTIGYNSLGQLGIGNTETYYQNFVTPNISNVKDVSISTSNTYFLLNDGTVYSCGSNIQGALAVGNVSDRSTPTKISISGVKEIISGYYSIFFIKEDNSVYVAGYNERGKLGLGHTDTSVYYPTLNPYIKNYKKIVIHDKHCLFLTNDNKVYGFGDNINGQLGLGKTSIESKPVLIPIDNVVDFDSTPYISTLNFSLTPKSEFDYNKNEGNFLFDINISDSNEKVVNYTIKEQNIEKPIFTADVDINDFPSTINERVPLNSLRDGINQINVSVKTDGDNELISKIYLIKGKNYHTWFDKLVKLKKTTNVKDNNLLLKLNSNGKVIPFTLHDNGEINLVKQQELIPVDKTSNNIQIGFVMEKNTELNSYGIAWL